MSSPAGGARAGGAGTGPSQRERQRAETRNRIFQAALAEFRAVGFGHAQIERIAGAAGVVRGTFYFHFPSKEHVLLELQKRVQEVLLGRLVGLRSGPPLREILAAVGEGVLAAETLVGDDGLMRAVVSMYIRQPIDPAAQETPAPVVETLARAFGGAAGRGELRPDLDPVRAAALVLTSVFGLYARPGGSEARLPVDLDDLMRVLERGLAAAPGGAA